MARAEESLIKALGFGLRSGVKIALAGTALLAMRDQFGQMPPDFRQPVEVVIVDSTDTILKQGDKEFKLKTARLSEESKKSLLEQRPDLRAFLEGGPIHILEKPE